jgi:hypothetical protein
MLLTFFIGIVVYLYFHKEEHKTYGNLMNLLSLSFVLGLVGGLIGLIVELSSFHVKAIFTHFSCSLPDASNLCGLGAPVYAALLGYCTGVLLYLFIWVIKSKQ